MSKNYYDHVAKKFGGFAYGKQPSKITPNVPGGLPDDVFLGQLNNLCGSDKVALDVGCGDGKMAINLSDRFDKIVGIDRSTGLLKVAREKRRKLGIDNITFLNMDAKEITLQPEMFDVAYSYRSPIFYKGVYRVLKKGGSYIALAMGGKDCADFKKLFNEGTVMHSCPSVLVHETKKAQQSGFKVVFKKEIFYHDYFTGEDDLDLYLQKVPLVSYDSVKDKELLQRVVENLKTENGIDLHRHRIVFRFDKC